MPTDPVDLEELADRRRIRRNVFMKSVREQSKRLALQAFWRLVQSVANDRVNRYQDGTVDWLSVREEIDGIMEELENAEP